MLDPPTQSTMTELLGQALFEVLQELCSAIDEKYDMEKLWNTGVRTGLTNIITVEAVKRFAASMQKIIAIGFMIIFGKDERAKFEDIRGSLFDAVCRRYDEAKTYRDGKWVMFEPTDTTAFDDYIKLLAIKRKPNRK